MTGVQTCALPISRAQGHERTWRLGLGLLCNVLELLGDGLILGRVFDCAFALAFGVAAAARDRDVGPARETLLVEVLVEDQWTALPQILRGVQNKSARAGAAHQRRVPLTSSGSQLRSLSGYSSQRTKNSRFMPSKRCRSMRSTSNFSPSLLDSSSPESDDDEELDELDSSSLAGFFPPVG